MSPDPGGNVLTDHVMEDFTGERGGRVASCFPKELNNIEPLKKRV